MRASSPSSPAKLEVVRGRDSAETKARLLEAASELFAERGYAGTSMRAVTQAAGVSVSSANYHFGSKQALLHATLAEVIGPVNRERIDRLTQLEAAAGADGPDLESILEAFLAPAVERRDAASGRDAFRRLAARLYSDPPDVVAAFKLENFVPLTDRFLAALQRALPPASKDRVELAFQLVVGMMVHVIAGQLELGKPVGPAPPPDAELTRMIVRFAAAGLRSELAEAQP